MNNLKFYSDGGKTTGVMVKLDSMKGTLEWHLFIYSLGLIMFNNYSIDYKIIGVDEI